MASDTTEKEEAMTPSKWVLVALGLLVLMAVTDAFVYDVPNFNDDPWDAEAPELPPREATLPGPTPALFALRAQLERERFEAAKRVEDVAPLESLRVPARRLLSKKDDAWASALRPLWGLEHDPAADAVLSLGFGYRTHEFARFVSTLRGTGFGGDIVLATGPRFQQGVAAYLKANRVLAYQFTYECARKQAGKRPGQKGKKKVAVRGLFANPGGRRLLVTPGGCTLTNWYGAGDARPPRPLAIARYEMYRTWLSFYGPSSWAIVFDFRDTFFQRDPFTLVDRSSNAPNLHLFAENRLVKRVGNCPFNGQWMRCFLSKPEVKALANHSVVCSGSTMGSVPALTRYVERMVKQMDKSQCSRAGFGDSDQGYHNYLYDTGELAKLPGVRVTHHEQGHGLVNTIGAMNGFRIPAELRGSLADKWKIRDAEGYVLNDDGTRSAVVHQWDRFYREMFRFVDGLAKRHRDAGKAAVAGLRGARAESIASGVGMA